MQQRGTALVFKILATSKYVLHAELVHTPAHMRQRMRDCFYIISDVSAAVVPACRALFLIHSCKSAVPSEQVPRSKFRASGYAARASCLTKYAQRARTAAAGTVVRHVVRKPPSAQLLACM